MNSYKSHTLFYKQKIMNIQKEFDNNLVDFSITLELGDLDE